MAQHSQRYGVSLGQDAPLLGSTLKPSAGEARW